jgi:hypothetical protein
MNKREDIAKAELWIGLAKVEQSSGSSVLGNADGAYTNAIAVADNRASFRSKVKDALAELGLRLTRLENAEPLKARSARWLIDAELTKIAKETSETGHVGFGTFHAFDAN